MPLNLTGIGCILRVHISTKASAIIWDRANPLTTLGKVEFRARFRVMKQCFADLLTARLRNCKTMVVHSLVSMTTTSRMIVLTNQMPVYKNSQVIPRIVIPRLGMLIKCQNYMPRINLRITIPRFIPIHKTGHKWISASRHNSVIWVISLRVFADCLNVFLKKYFRTVFFSEWRV